jgi:cytochrome b pre-mRNA-processing protein 3
MQMSRRSKGPMLGFLFRGLTAAPTSGAALFDALTREARQPHWFVEGRIADTLDGRFAVLATVIAMTLARLEHEGEAANELSVALTERFIEVMESEHRELGLGDPTLGKTVRKLVGMLGRRTSLWRSAAAGELDWIEATRDSLYRDGAEAAELDHSVLSLKRLKERLERSPPSSLQKGQIE